MEGGEGGRIYIPDIGIGLEGSLWLSGRFLLSVYPSHYCCSRKMGRYCDIGDSDFLLYFLVKPKNCRVRLCLAYMVNL